MQPPAYMFLSFLPKSHISHSHTPIQLRKKKRATLEEEHELDDEEYKKEVEGFDSMDVSMGELPEDLVGRFFIRCMWLFFNWHGENHIHVCVPLCPPDPAIVVEEDSKESVKKILKTIGFPIMDNDALPSTYTQKVLLCLSKWRQKIQALAVFVEELLEPDEHVAMHPGIDTTFSILGMAYHVMYFVLTTVYIYILPEAGNQSPSSGRTA